MGVIGEQAAAVSPLGRPTAGQYDRDLQTPTTAIDGLRDHALTTPIDIGDAARFLTMSYQLATLTGELSQLPGVCDGLDRAMVVVGEWPDWCLLKASVYVALHRFPDAELTLSKPAWIRDTPEGRAISGDLHFQAGRYDEARRAYESAIEHTREWDAVARLAHLTAKMGDASVADELYAAAEYELTAKQMRSYAWLELQRGLLAFGQGDHDLAALRYARADEAYSGWWLVAKHRAGLLSAQGDKRSAAAICDELCEGALRPEILHLAGDLYARMGMQDEARYRHAAALAAYLSSAGRGEVHYYHHLADFYVQVRHDGKAALEWARKDLALRQNFSAQATLARALMCDGQVDAASATIEAVLESGIRDPAFLAEAGRIFEAAGRETEAGAARRLAGTVTPHFGESYFPH